jgi:hypothetical protein
MFGRERESIYCKKESDKIVSRHICTITNRKPKMDIKELLDDPIDIYVPLQTENIELFMINNWKVY